MYCSPDCAWSPLDLTINLGVVHCHMTTIQNASQPTPLFVVFIRKLANLIGGFYLLVWFPICQFIPWGRKVDDGGFGSIGVLVAFILISILCGALAAWHSPWLAAAAAFVCGLLLPFLTTEYMYYTGAAVMMPVMVWVGGIILTIMGAVSVFGKL